MIDTNDTLNCKTWPYSWNISNVTNVHKVVSNENQVCALMKDASSTCWNYASQSESHPFSAAKDIIANGSIICAHKNDNKVMCTWWNGYEPYYNTTASNIINWLWNVTGIYADMGTSQMCATTISGQIRCWNTSSAYSPASLDSWAPNVGEPIKKLMLDWYQFSCYLTYSGHVGCWWWSSSIVANIPSIMNSNIDNIFSADDDPNRTSTSIHILRDGHVGMWWSEYRSYNTSNLSSFVPESYYFLSNSSAFEAEWSTVTISITATNVPTDISIPYTINGINVNDIASWDLNGTVSLHNGLGEITLTLSEDQTTEGSEVMHINLNNGSAILDIEVYDTSINP